MSELPLSKFAPFNKEECKFQYEVSNKLDEIGVKCSNCIYFGNELPKDKDYPIHPMEMEKQLYDCSLLTNYDNGVCENSLCRFFTNKDEIEDTEDEMLPQGESDEELSTALQKLDFTNNSGVKKSIKTLREKLINEDQ